MKVEDMAKTLDLLFEPGQVIELRVLSKKKGDKGSGGYYKNIDRLMETALVMDGTNNHFGIYVVMNKIIESCYARAPDTFVPSKDSPLLTSEGNIEKRRWLLIDFDPTRPTGISSTDGEKEKAFVMARGVRAWLTDMNWPEPILADSGNGCHLLYKIDLPNTQDEKDLIKEILGALDQMFSTEEVLVDTQNIEANRVVKFYGTMVRKGGNTEDRPWRRSGLVETPDEIAIVEKENLVEIASFYEEDQDEKEIKYEKTDVGEWLEKHGMTIHKTKRTSTGTTYVLDRCPWDSSHTDKAAYVFQGNRGGVKAVCFHKSCRGKGWRDLWDMYEAHRDRLDKNAQYLETRIKESKKAKLQHNKEELGETSVYREVTSEELEQCGIDTNPRLELNLPDNNFIMKFLKYGKQCSDAYDEIWIAGAITILSTLTHRNIELKMKHGTIKTNTWCQCIGKSSATRKSTVISKVELILKTVGTINCLPDDMSPEAMVDVLSEDPRAYMLADESASVMEGFKKDYQKGMKDVLMKMYDGKDFVRRLRPKKNQPNIFVVNNPFLTVLMATTPTRYAASTQEEDKMSGWFQRFIYFYPNADNEDWRPMLEEVEEDITAEIDCIASALYIKEKLFNLDRPMKMCISKEGTDFFNKWQRKMDKECKKLKNDSIEGVYNRLPVYALKLAMLFEIGNMEHDSEAPTTISIEMIKEACRVIDEFFIPMALIVEKIIGKTIDKNLMDRIMATLTTRGGKETKRNVMRSLHAKIKDLDDAIEALVFANEVELVTETKRGGTVTWVVMESEADKTTVTTSRKKKNEEQEPKIDGLPKEKVSDNFQPIYIQQNNNNIHIIDKEEKKGVTCHVENVNDKEKENIGKTTGQLDSFGDALRFRDATTKDEIANSMPKSNVVVTPCENHDSFEVKRCNICKKSITSLCNELPGIGEVCNPCFDKKMKEEKKRKDGRMMKACKYCGNPNAGIHLYGGEMICMKCSNEGKDTAETRGKRKPKKQKEDKMQRIWK